jgi:hypothetical protein
MHSLFKSLFPRIIESKTKVQGAETQPLVLSEKTKEIELITMEAKQSPTAFATISGRLIDSRNFKASDVRAWDIAWSLHYTLRYNGHTPVAWDVLSHTGLVYQLALHGEKEISLIDQLGILLHDAAEYAIGDIISPVKCQYPEITKQEEKILRQIFLRFNAEYDAVNWKLVKKYDLEALWTEQKLLNRGGDLFYGGKGYHSPITELIKVKCVDYVAMLKHLAINRHAPNVTGLLAVPHILVPYIGAANDPTLSPTQSVLPTTQPLDGGKEDGIVPAGTHTNKTKIVKGPQITYPTELGIGPSHNDIEHLTA